MMRRYSVGVFFVLCWILSAKVGAGDGILGQRPSFGKIVLDSLDMRSQLLAGEFAYRMSYKENDKELSSSIQKGIYAYDTRTSTSLHVFIKSSRESDTEIGIKRTLSGAVYLPPPELSLFLVRDLKTTTAIVDPLQLRTPTFAPFDFRAFGMQLMGDFLGNESFERVFLNHLGLAEDKVQVVETDEVASDPQTRRDLQGTVSYNYGGSIMSFDPQKEFWAVRQRYEVDGYLRNKDGSLKKMPRELRSGTDIELVQFGGHWVPSRVKIMDSSRSYTIDFEWKKLNNPVDEMEITFDRAKDLASLFNEEQQLTISQFKPQVEGK